LAFEAATDGIPPSSVILTGTGSTTAAGWLHHSSFDDSTPDAPTLCLWVACATARLLLNHSLSLFSKWFPGKENEVADSLSHDHHIANATLHSLLHSSFPEHMISFPRKNAPKSTTRTAQLIASIAMTLTKTETT
jgi:hypothetical protein